MSLAWRAPHATDVNGPEISESNCHRLSPVLRNLQAGGASKMSNRVLPKTLALLLFRETVNLGLQPSRSNLGTSTLKSRVLGQIALFDRAGDGRRRAWTVGCASGNERVWICVRDVGCVCPGICPGTDVQCPASALPLVPRALTRVPISNTRRAGRWSCRQSSATYAAGAREGRNL